MFGLEKVSLAESIKTQGVLSPILVRPLPEGFPEHFEIVTGARRFRAVLYRGIDADDRTSDDSIVGVDGGGLANLHVARLRFGDLQPSQQVIGLHHFRQHRPRRTWRPTCSGRSTSTPSIPARTLFPIAQPKENGKSRKSTKDLDYEHGSMIYTAMQTISCPHYLCFEVRSESRRFA